MSKRSIRRFFMSVSIAVAVGLLAGPVAQAQEAGKTATQAGKTGKAKKKGDTKKAPAPAKAAACEQNGKKWADGKHCMVRCDDKGIMCDMRICANGNWKNYGSCFGPSAVSPNCPPSCG